MRRRHAFLLLTVLALVCAAPATHAAPTQRDRPLGVPVTETVNVDATGCLLAPADTGTLEPPRRFALAARGVFANPAVDTPCSTATAFQGTWRFGRVHVVARSGRSVARTVPVRVERVDHHLGDEWLVSRVLEQEIRVIAEHDQCSPPGRWRVEERADEVRVRYHRASSYRSCTLIAFAGWAEEHVLSLAAPIGSRTLVVERPTPTREWFDVTCTWQRDAAIALEGDSTAAQRQALADRLDDEAISDSGSWTVHQLVAEALASTDRDRRTRIAAALRTDTARDGYPASCNRLPELPPVTSTAPTAVVATGGFSNSGLVGLDAAGAVTWANPWTRSGLVVRCPPPLRPRVISFDTTFRQGLSYGTATHRTLDPQTGAFGTATHLAMLRGVEERALRATCDSRGGVALMIEGEYENFTGFRFDVWYAAPGAGSRRVVHDRFGRGGLGGSSFVGIRSNPNGTGPIVHVDLRTGARTTGPNAPAVAAQLVSPDGRSFVSDGNARVRRYALGRRIRLVSSHPSFPTASYGWLPEPAWLDGSTLVRWKLEGRSYRGWLLRSDGRLVRSGMLLSKRLDRVAFDRRTGDVYGWHELSEDSATYVYRARTRTLRPFGGALSKQIHAVIPVE